MTNAVQLGCQAHRTMEAVQTWSSHFPRMALFTSPVWIYVYVNALYKILSLVSTGSFLTLMASFSRRFSCKYIFICLCPGVNYQYSWSPLFLQSFMVCLVVPSQIWCHINGCSHPGTANCMAPSRPSISLWHDTYTSNVQPASLTSDDNSR